MSVHRKLVLAFCAALLLVAGAPGQAPTNYEAEIAEWRQSRDQELRQKWLPLVGLYWLSEGENAFGTDARLPLPLPPDSAPARAGVFIKTGERIRLRVADGVPLRVNGKAVKEAEIRSDADGQPDTITLKNLTLFIIHRGDRYGLRVRQSDSRQAADFEGVQHYPVAREFRVTAEFVPYSTPKQVSIPTVTGIDTVMTSPGYVNFRLRNRTLRLEPVLETADAQELFFIFKDQTAGSGTYPGGRYLYSPLPQNGVVELDFNKAFNPPCAFTAFATCPLPLPENSLAIPIPAGEKYSTPK